MTNLTQQLKITLLSIHKQLRLIWQHILDCQKVKFLTALPARFVRVFPAHRAEEILTSVAQWGIFTTIIEKGGSIFEIKDRSLRGL